MEIFSGGRGGRTRGETGFEMGSEADPVSRTTHQLIENIIKTTN
jgi:hypothetical protein